jgi:hypothetical protein
MPCRNRVCRAWRQHLNDRLLQVFVGLQFLQAHSGIANHSNVGGPSETQKEKLNVLGIIEAIPANVITVRV